MEIKEFSEKLKSNIQGGFQHHANLIVAKNFEDQDDISNAVIEAFKSIYGKTCEPVFYIKEEKINKVVIKDIINLFSIRNVQGYVRYFILQNAELLEESAANSFLKILEEPPESFYCFMVTDNENKILDTIKSRSIIYNLNSKKKYSLEILNKIEKNNIFLLSKEILELPNNKIIREFETFYLENYISFTNDLSKKYIQLCERIKVSNSLFTVVDDLLSIIWKVFYDKK